MGGSNSTRSHVISYQDALLRLGTTDATRYEATFRNLCARVGASSITGHKKASSVSPSSTLTFDSFWKYVVTPTFPTAPKWLFQRFFAAISDLQKMPGDASASITSQAAVISDVNNPLALTLEDWTCAVCLILKGTFEEKAKFLARLLDNGSGIVTFAPVSTSGAGGNDSMSQSNGYQTNGNVCNAAIFTNGRIRYDMLLRTVSEILYDKKTIGGVASIEKFVKETMIACWTAGEDERNRLKETPNLSSSSSTISVSSTREFQHVQTIARSRRSSFGNADGNTRNAITITADEFRLWAIKQSKHILPSLSSSSSSSFSSSSVNNIQAFAWGKNPLLGWIDYLTKLFKTDQLLRPIALSYTSGRGETLKSFLLANKLKRSSSSFSVPVIKDSISKGSSILQTTRLESIELSHLSKAFVNARLSSRSGLFDPSVMHSAFLPGSPRVLNEALFRACDQARNSAISVSDLSNVAAVLLHGSLTLQARLLFSMFSSNPSSITSTEFNSLLLIAQWVGNLVNQTAPEPITSHQELESPNLPVIFDSSTGTSNTKLLLRLQSDAQSNLSKLVDAACEEMRVRSFPISLDIFIKWTTNKHPELLACLEPLKMALRIELGVKPPFGSRKSACKSITLPLSSSSSQLSQLAVSASTEPTSTEPTRTVFVSDESSESIDVTESRNASINNEGDVIASCWRSYSRDDAIEEDHWFVVPSTWWRHWCVYSKFKEALDRLKGENNQDITSQLQKSDEPTISVSSSTETPETLETPGLIPTHLLLVDHLVVSSNNNSTNTFQSVKQSENSIMTQPAASSSLLPARLLPLLSRGYANDFVLVPPRVWKGLSLWYGVSGPPIRRQVICTHGFRNPRVSTSFRASQTQNQTTASSSSSSINDKKKESFLELELYPLVIRAQLLQVPSTPSSPSSSTLPLTSTTPIEQNISSTLPKKAPLLIPVLNIEVLGDQTSVSGSTGVAVDVFMFSRADRLTTVRERLARAVKKDASHVRLWRPMPRATILALTNGIDTQTSSLLGLFPYSPLWGMESSETISMSNSSSDFQSIASWDLVKSSPGSVFLGNVYPPLVDGTQLLVDVQIVGSTNLLEDMSLSRNSLKKSTTSSTTTSSATVTTWTSIHLGYQSAYDTVIHAVEAKAIKGGKDALIEPEEAISVDRIVVNQEIVSGGLQPIESSKKDQQKQQQLTRSQPLTEIQHQRSLLALNAHRASPITPQVPLPRPFRLRPRSLLGLTNLGNTCYLSSAFQCLLSLPFFSHYFLSGLWEADLNVEAKDGTGGTLAAAFALTVQEAWGITAAEGERTAVMTPKRLKAYLAYSAHQYRGKDQHDANEALDHILTLLSEDLNRVHGPKPFKQAPDSDGRPDAEVAEEYFVHQIFGRDKSFITAMMTGQFKSSLVCENCGHSNVVFDPFRPLQVTLPEPISRAFTVMVVFANSLEPMLSRPLVVTVHVPLTATIGDLKKAIAAAAREHQQRRGVISNSSVSVSPFTDDDGGDEVLQVKKVSDNDKEGEEDKEEDKDKEDKLVDTVSSSSTRMSNESSQGMESNGISSHQSLVPSFEAQSPSTERNPHLFSSIPISEEQLFLVRASCQCLEDLGLGDLSPISSAQKLSEQTMTALVAYQTTPEAQFKAEHLTAAQRLATSKNVKDALFSPGAPVYIWTSLGSKDGSSHKWRQGYIVSREKSSSKLKPSTNTQGAHLQPVIEETLTEHLVSPLTSPLPVDIDSDDSTGGIRTRAARDSLLKKDESDIASVPIESSSVLPPSPPTMYSPPSALVHTVAILGISTDVVIEHNVVRLRLEPRYPIPVTIHLHHRTFLIVGTGSSPFGNLAEVGKGTLGPGAPLHEPVGVGASGLAYVGSTVPPASASSSAFFLTNLTRFGFGPPSLFRLLPSRTSLSELYVRTWLSAKRFIRRRAPFEQDDDSLSSSSSITPCIPEAPFSLCELQENANRAPSEVAARIMSNWGFVLRKSFSNGSSGCPSPSCQWFNGCDGCVIAPDKNMTIASAGLGSGMDASSDGFGGGCWISLAVEWDPSIIEQSYDRQEAFAKDFHPSVNRARAEAEKPISLERCLEQSSKSERLEGQYCSKCSKVKKRVKKRMGMATFLSSGSTSSSSSASSNSIGSGYDPSPTSSAGAPSQVSTRLFNENKLLLNTPSLVDIPLADDEEEVEEIVERVKIKTLEVYRLPPILVIQLKRFRFTGGSASGGGSTRGKLSTRVSFPVSRNLCMRPHMTRGPLPIGEPADVSMWKFLGGKEEDTPTIRQQSSIDSSKVATSLVSRSKRRSSGGPTERLIDGLPLLLSRSCCDFELFAVINHFGALSGGHYVATARAPVNDRWYAYDDQKVTPLSSFGPELDAQVCTPAAYILFYVRRDIAAGWRASLQTEDEVLQRSLELGTNTPTVHISRPKTTPYKIPTSFQHHSENAFSGHYDDLGNKELQQVSVESLFPLPNGLSQGYPDETVAKVLERVSGSDIALDGLEPGPATNTVSGGAVAGALASVLSVVPGVDRTLATETARGIVNNVTEGCIIA
jgi:ubiquitin C-terminal hydrolase